MQTIRSMNAYYNTFNGVYNRIVEWNNMRSTCIHIRG